MIPQPIRAVRAALCAVVLAASAMPGSTQVSDRVMAGPGLERTANETAGIQSDLVWLGLLDSPANGVRRPDLDRSIRDFEAVSGGAPTGQLSEVERLSLSRRAGEIRADAAFREVRDDWTGIRLRLPTEFFEPPEIFSASSAHIIFRARSATGLLLRLERYFGNSTPRAFLDTMIEAAGDCGDVSALARGTDGNIAYLSYLLDGRRVLSVFEIRPGETRGIEFHYDDSARFSVQPILTDALASLRLHDGEGGPPRWPS